MGTSSCGVFLRVWRSLASGFYLMDYLRDCLRDYLMDYFMDYLRDYLSIVETLAVLAAFMMTEDP